MSLRYYFVYVWCERSPDVPPFHGVGQYSYLSRAFCCVDRRHALELTKTHVPLRPWERISQVKVCRKRGDVDIAKQMIHQQMLALQDVMSA